MTQVAANARELMDEAALSAFVGVTMKTLQKWRWQRTGPAFVKMGRLIRYRRADVDAWLESRLVATRDMA